MCLDVVDRHRHRIAYRNLMGDNPLFEATGARRPCRLSHGGVGGVAIKRQHSLEPCLGRGRVGFQPLRCRDLRCLVQVQYSRHHFALAAQRKLEIPEQSADVGALGAVAPAGHGVDGCAAEIGAEDFIAPAEILQREAHVHGMRLPRQKHDRILLAIGAFDLSQHALLAGLDQFEFTQTKLILLQHFQHVAVAVIAGLDPVDGVIERRRETLNILEVFQTSRVGVDGNRQGVLGACQIRSNYLDRAVIHVPASVSLLGRHPIAQEHVDVVIVKRRKSDRNRKHGNGRRIAYGAEQLADQCCRGGHIRPAHVGKADYLAARRLTRGAWHRGARDLSHHQRCQDNPRQ